MSGNITKVLLVGPALSGKSTLANFLSDAKENAVGSFYRPTAGCRLLEFEYQDSSSTKSGIINREIQIWDCSGDPKFHFFLPTIATGCHAVLLVYDASKDDYVSELEGIYNKWNDIFGLGPSRYLVVARKWGNGQPSNKRIIKMGSLARISRVEWDIDDEGFKVRNEFTSFINSVLMDVRNKREEEEITLLKM